MRSALTHNDMTILVNQFLFDGKSAVAVRGREAFDPEQVQMLF